MSSEAFSSADFLVSVEQTSIGVHFIASVLIIPRIPSPCQLPLFNEWNGLEKCRRLDYFGTNVNQGSN